MTDLTVPRNPTTRTHRRIGAAVPVLTLAAALFVTAGNSAVHADPAEGPCTLQGDVRYLPTDAGGAVVASQVCNANEEWETTSTYAAADEKTIIWEPRFDQLNFSSGGPNPFTADYVYSKAQSLFPTPGSFQIAYARNALDPKNRSKDTRNQTSVNDQCLFYPKRWSANDIEFANVWLPPAPTPDGRTGTLSYTITGMDPDSENPFSKINGETIRAAISQYNESALATKNPILVPWKSGDPDPTISFAEDPGIDTDKDGTIGVSRHKTTDTVNGLRRWVTGDISITPNPYLVSARMIAHEILHVALGYDHMPFENGSLFTMSPVLDAIDHGTLLRTEPAIDTCTEKGMALAPNVVIGP